MDPETHVLKFGLKNTKLKQKQTHRSRKQISGCQRVEGLGEGQYR